MFNLTTTPCQADAIALVTFLRHRTPHYSRTAVAWAPCDERDPDGECVIYCYRTDGLPMESEDREPYTDALLAYWLESQAREPVTA